ncbi:MAG: OmpH family outer membrane protein [Kiritimatiellae bacterium]|nr:OmpH family outer membrane protein [Kiritimatiellia bacterium]
MKKILMGIALAAAVCASADMKIGTVNMVDLVRLHPNHESNKALVKSTDKDYKAKLDRQQESAKAIADEGKKVQADLMNPMLSASAKTEAQKKLEDVQRRFLAAQQELRSAAQHYQGELTDLETRLLKIETEDIRAKINAYAKANGYDIIADSTMLAFSRESIDVTDEILKAMNVDPAKRKEKKSVADAKAK